MRRPRFTALLLLVLVALAAGAQALDAIVPIQPCGHDHGQCRRCALWCARHPESHMPAKEGAGHGHDHAVGGSSTAATPIPAGERAGASNCVLELTCGHQALDALAARGVAARLPAPAGVLPALTSHGAPVPRALLETEIAAFPPPSPPPRQSL